MVKVLIAEATMEVSDSESDDECNLQTIPAAPPVVPLISDAEAKRAFDAAYGRAEPVVVPHVSLFDSSKDLLR